MVGSRNRSPHQQYPRYHIKTAHPLQISSFSTHHTAPRLSIPPKPRRQKVTERNEIWPNPSQKPTKLLSLKAKAHPWSSRIFPSNSPKLGRYLLRSWLLGFATRTLW